MRVLLVDDEREFVSALAERLSFRGINADWATTGEEAMALVRNHEYQVAVLDMKMPGINGIELKRELEKARPNMNYIFYTGHGSRDDFMTGKDEAVHYLFKPMPLDDLIKKIIEAADSHGAA